MVIYQRAINTSFEVVDETVLTVIEKLKAFGLEDPHKLFRINFMMRELMNNAAEHGNALEYQKNISCRVEVHDNLFRFFVSDQGHGFDFDSAKSTAMSNVEVLTHRSRGFSTIIAMGFDLTYNEGEIIAELDISKEESYEK